MYRVTTLKNGVLTDDCDEFASPVDVIHVLMSFAGEEYFNQVKTWMDEDSREPLVINESSIYSDLWEYIP